MSKKIKLWKIMLVISLASLMVYVIFLHKEHQYFAGQTQSHSLFDKLLCQNKFKAESPTAFYRDRYKLQIIKTDILGQLKKIEDYKKEMSIIQSKIRSSNNSISNYAQYISDLESLKFAFDYYLDDLRWRKKDLTKLKYYISQIERDLTSIGLYNSQFTELFTTIRSSELEVQKTIRTIDHFNLIAANNKADLKEKTAFKEERKRKYREKLAQIEFELQEIIREELSKENRTNYSTNYPDASYTSISTYTSPANIGYDYSRRPTSSYSTPYYSSSAFSTNTNTDHVRVEGYYRSNGTYVEPYIRTAPNSTTQDNFSTNPNLNPYTQTIGSKRK